MTTERVTIKKNAKREIKALMRKATNYAGGGYPRAVALITRDGQITTYIGDYTIPAREESETLYSYPVSKWGDWQNNFTADELRINRDRCLGRCVCWEYEGIEAEVNEKIDAFMSRTLVA